MVSAESILVTCLLLICVIPAAKVLRHCVLPNHAKVIPILPRPSAPEPSAPEPPAPEPPAPEPPAPEPSAPPHEKLALSGKQEVCSLDLISEAALEVQNIGQGDYS